MTALASQDPAAAGQVEPARPGRTELGLISVDDRVVAKLAAQAALEIPDAGAAAPRVLGRPVSGVGMLGVRQTNLSALPKAHAEVDGSSARIELSVSVRWPVSVPAVTAAVRAHVIERLGELTGLQVSEVRIDVTDLVTHLDPPPRVQ
jgi:uncharacterized alkaline shock family protein YloU